MNTIDNREEVEKIDQGGMYEFIYDFPSQFEDGLKRAQEVHLPRWGRRQVRNILVAGLGGSAIGGDLVRSYLAKKLNIPFFICRNYHLPNWVLPATLVFISSYSGNTEETLSSFQDALQKGAKIICLSSDGEVEKISTRESVPCVRLPKGYQPRAALGYSFVPILVLLERLGFAQGEEENLRKTKDFLEKNRDKYKMEIETEKNPAKQLAMKLHQKLPIVYAATDHFDAVSTRWKGQCCENAKMLAFNNVFPEFNHNELVGWKILSDYRDDLVVVILKDQGDHPRIQKRMEIVKGIIEKLKVEVIEVESSGENLLSRMFSLIQLGDFTSFYLSILNGEDPSPVKVIDFLKGELAKE